MQRCRVEVQLLVNEDGEVIFANPLSGPEELSHVIEVAASASCALRRLLSVERTVPLC